MVKKGKKIIKKSKDDEKEIKNTYKIFFILGVVIIIGIAISLLVFEDARIAGKIILKDDFAPVQKICKEQCKIQNITNYCCKSRWINEEYYNCQQDILKTECGLDCEGICESYCSTIKYMIPCARAGCSWIVKGPGGSNYCKIRRSIKT